MANAQGYSTKLALNNARVDIIAILKALGNYVTFTANGDSAMIGSTAFDTRKIPQPVIVGKPTVQVEQGVNSSELINIADTAGKGRSFVHQYTPDPPADVGVPANIQQSLKWLSQEKFFIPVS